MNSDQKIWNTEPLWPCVSSCKLCRKTGSFCIFSMNSFFSWCSTTCALAQHVHRKTQKKAFISPKYAERFGHMAKYDRYDDICHIFHQPQTDLTKDICEHDLWIQTQQSFLSVSVEIGWQQTLPLSETNGTNWWSPIDKSVSTSFGARLLPCFLETGQNFFLLVETWPVETAPGADNPLRDVGEIPQLAGLIGWPRPWQKRPGFWNETSKLKMIFQHLDLQKEVNNVSTWNAIMYLCKLLIIKIINVFFHKLQQNRDSSKIHQWWRMGYGGKW